MRQGIAHLEVRELRGVRRARAVLRAGFVLNIALIALALSLWGASEVRHAPVELIRLTIAGAIGLWLTDRAFPWLGLSARIDALEQRNPAALIALCGARTATALIYGFGSAGEGPELSENFFCAALGVISLLALWAVLEAIARVSFSVTIERDVPAGLRFAAFVLAESLVLGRALAGRWHSVEHTLEQFWRHAAVPACTLLAVAVIVEVAARSARARRGARWLSGELPSAGYLLFAAVCLARSGAWEGMP